MRSGIISAIAAILALFGLAAPAIPQVTGVGMTVCSTPTQAVTTSSANAQLSACGNTVQVWNVGTVEAFVAFGATNATVATANSDSIPAGSFKTYGVLANLRYMAAITASSSTTLRISVGVGFPSAGVGGGAGGGGSTSVTQGTVPWVDSITLWGGGTLGAMANYGTSPGAVLVPGVNAYVTPPARAARNFPGCTVGATSGSCLAANTAVGFLQIENTAASNAIACAFGATAVLNSSTSVQLAPGQGASWGPGTGGVPTGQMNCIAAGAGTPLYVEWN